MKQQSFPNGLTVAELKELIKDWPETNECGEPTEVWFENEDGVSSIIRSVWPLNLDEGGAADILFDLQG